MAHGETYEEFVDKFQPKKTTDDCYTPPEVYEAVRQWVGDKVMPLAEGVEIVRPFRPGGDYQAEVYPEGCLVLPPEVYEAVRQWVGDKVMPLAEGVEIVRPFRPGGDYQAEVYPEGCLVLDNPPFSILASIVDWYILHGIRFFLFAPQLTLFNYCSREEVTGIVCNARVTYANGAKVSTSFITNCYPGAPAFVVAGDLCKLIEEADRKALAEKKPKARPLIGYPAQVVVASVLGKLVTRGIEWKAPRSETMFARKLDCGKGLFGAGFLLSERLAAERPGSVLPRLALNPL